MIQLQIETLSLGIIVLLYQTNIWHHVLPLQGGIDSRKMPSLRERCPAQRVVCTPYMHFVFPHGFVLFDAAFHCAITFPSPRSRRTHAP